MEVREQEKELEKELKDDFGLKDYQVDTINERSSLYFQDRSWEADVKAAKKAMDMLIIGISVFAFCLVFLFCTVYLGIFPFIYLYIGAQWFVLFWRFVISPLRHHAFSSTELLVKYRCYLVQEKRWKAFLKDDKYKILALIYMLLDFMVICSVFDTPRMLPYLNNIIFDRGEYPLSTITSLVPGVVIIGLVINVFGAILVAKYEGTEKGTGRKIKMPMARNLLLICVIASVIALMILGMSSATEFTAFMKPSPSSESWLYYFDDEQPMFRARLAVFTYYGIVYAGAVFLAFMAVSGLTVMESMLVLGRLNRHWSRTKPVEKNWEFQPTARRQARMIADKIKTRKVALAEIGIFCVGAILAMWLFMKWGGEIMDIEWMNITSYVLLGLIAIWYIIFSPIYHAKKDGRYHYPTAKHNIGYAMFDERGLGSFKYYFREVFKKKRSLVLWTLYWFLMLTSVFNFNELKLSMMNWRAVFENASTVPAGVIINFSNYFITAPNDVALSIVLFDTVLTIIAFIAALGKTKDQFKGSTFWCTFNKALVGLVMVACFFWITKIPQITSAVNLLSLQFLTAIGVTVLFFGIAAVVLIFFVIPFIVKFDNLGAPKKEIVIQIAMTIVLVWVVLLVFDFVLPMTGVDGQPINYGYPFTHLGSDYEVQTLVDNFDLGVFLMEWFGRYITWGTVQQFLFMSIFLTLWRKVFPRSKGYMVAFGTSCIFGVIHAVDWPLMLFTFIAGQFWAKYWDAEYYDKTTGRTMRGNNLLLWGLLHGFGGSIIYFLMPFIVAVGPFNLG
nr:hypothetical protein [Candidatus Sigynarchaeota archaeon]